MGSANAGLKIISLSAMREHDEVQDYLCTVGDEIPGTNTDQLDGIRLQVVRLLASPKTLAAIRNSFETWDEETSQTKLKTACLAILDGTSTPEDVDYVNAGEEEEEAEEEDDDDEEDDDEEPESDDDDGITVDSSDIPALKQRKDALATKSRNTAEHREYLHILMRLDQLAK